MMHLRSVAVFAGVLALQAPAGAQADREVKPGWSTAAVAAYSRSCSEGVIVPARRDYAAAAERAGNANPRPFPEGELRDSVEPMCACIARRVATTHALEPGVDAAVLARPYVQEAMAGRECAPQGLLGEILKLRRDGAR